MLPLARFGVVAVAAVVLAAPAPIDLDVAVPPGSPLDWTRSFPSTTPSSGPLFAHTPDAGDPAVNGNRTSSAPADAGMDVQTSSAFGLVRILTWDLAVHLTWVQSMPSPSDGPTTGRSGYHPPLPQAGDALYWMTTAALLRLLLHPQAVSQAEVVGHLVEIGEPSLAILEAASGEQSLSETTMTLEMLIRPARDAAPEPQPHDDPVAAMRLRFVFEELSTHFAHNPVTGFCERIFLFGDEFLPEVEAYSDDPNAFVRRNAVAALARYRDVDAIQRLVEVATTSKDPVALVRACAGIGRYRGKVSTAGLLERLKTTADPTLRVALCAALGRTREEEAVPALLDLGEEAFPKDADMLMAVLSSLAEMQPRKERLGVLKFAARIQRAAQKNPKEFAAQVEPTGLAADSVDAIEMRGEILEQLAVILRVRLDPSDQGLRRRVLGMRSRKAGGAGGQGWFLSTHTNDSLRDVHPPVRFLYLATLRGCGEDGVKALAEVAVDKRTEPALRGFAIGHLPWDDQVRVIGDILADDTEDIAMRIQAFEAAVGVNHPELVAMGKAILEEVATLEPGGGGAEQRYLGLAAVRGLSRRGVLEVSDLLPLLAHVRSERSSFDRLPEELRDHVEALVRRAAQGAQKVELDERINALVEIVLKNSMNPFLTEDTRARDRKHVLGLISGAPAHKIDANYLELVAQSILDFLLGYEAEKRNRALGEFAPVVKLEEEILLALGRTGKPQALELLLGVLSNRRNRHRGVACLALGMLGQAGGERTLASFLLDGDPFVRYCAYRSLSNLTGKDSAVDWMYGDGQERAKAAEEYFRWLLEKR